MAEAGADTARLYVNGGARWYGTGWYWDPWFGAYTFIPGGGIFYSPFGWGFYSPFAIYGSPYFYGGFYGRPHAFGEFHGRMGTASNHKEVFVAVFMEVVAGSMAEEGGDVNIRTYHGPQRKGSH